MNCNLDHVFKMNRDLPFECTQKESDFCMYVSIFSLANDKLKKTKQALTTTECAFSRCYRYYHLLATKRVIDDKIGYLFPDNVTLLTINL